MTPVPFSPVPIRVGAFELLEPLGSGGMAEVWRGFHRDRRTPVAFKIIAGKLAAQHSFRQAFRGEIQALAGLEHPHIIVVFDHGELPAGVEQASGGRLSSGSLFLAMELAGGGTLGQVHDPMPWLELKGTLLELLDALAHAHARGIVHLDLKPDNVLLAGRNDARPGLKLTDFGISHIVEQELRSRGERAREQDTQEHQVAGTPYYMAPEQFMGEWRDFGPWTDLYALGCMAYELAAGTPPFLRSSAILLGAAHLKDAPPPMASRMSTPAGFEAWVRRLLAKRPGDRFQCAADAARALEDLEPDLIVEADDGAEDAGYGVWEGGDDAAGQQADAELEEEAEGSSSITLRLEVDLWPPFPADWRRASAPDRPLELVGAGLGLFGLRPIPLVDRQQERDQIWAALQDVRGSRQARLMVLHGSSGTGKSRLAEWVAQHSLELGLVSVLKGVHSPDEGPLDGLAPMVARHLRCVGLDRSETLARTLRRLQQEGIEDELEGSALTELMMPFQALAVETPVGRPVRAGMLSGQGMPSEHALLEPGNRTIRFQAPTERYAVLRRLLERLARARPVILWLDDAQWGADSLAFVEYLLQSQAMGSSAVFILLTVQDEALAQRPVESAVLDRLVMLQRTTLQSVRPLAEGDHAELVRRLLGLEGALARQVAERTAGSPLFAVQLVGDWVERGVLELGRRGLVLRRGEKAALPDDLHDVWEARLQRVLAGQEPGAREALELAAALGRSVDEGEWQAVCLEAGVAIPEGLLEALFAHQLARWSEDASIGRGSFDRWIFGHALLHESIERTARESGRMARHHRACASTVRRRASNLREVADRLARHLLSAGALSEALEPLRLSADTHRERGEYAQAHAQLDRREQVLRRLGVPMSDARWGEGEVLRGNMFLAQGRTEAALGVATQLEQAARRWEWTALLPLALVLLGGVMRWRGDLKQAWELHRAALGLLEARGDRAGAAACLSALGANALGRGDLVVSAQLYRRATRLFRAVGDPVNRADTIQNLGYVAMVHGRRRRAAYMFERTIRRFDQLGCLSKAAKGRSLAGRLAQEEGDYDRAGILFQEAMATFEQIGEPLRVADTLSNLGELARLREDLEAAETLYRRSLALHLSLESSACFIPRLNLGLTLLAREQYREAREVLEASLEEIARAGRRGYLAWVHAGLLGPAAAEGDWGAWDRHIDQAVSRFEAPDTVRSEDVWPLEVAGRLAAAAGAAERALSAWRLAARMWRRLGREDRAVECEGWRGGGQ